MLDYNGPYIPSPTDDIIFFVQFASLHNGSSPMNSKKLDFA